MADKYPSIQVTISAEIIDEMDKLTRRIPNLNYSAIGTEALEPWIKEHVGREYELIHPESRQPFIKAAGAPFPRRLGDKVRGRPNRSRRRKRGKTMSFRLYSGERVIEAFKDICFWLALTRTYELEDLMRVHLEMEPPEEGG